MFSFRFLKELSADPGDVGMQMLVDKVNNYMRFRSKYFFFLNIELFHYQIIIYILTVKNSFLLKYILINPIFSRHPAYRIYEFFFNNFYFFLL